MALLWNVLGMACMAFGAVQVWRARGRVEALIVWGALVDAGFAALALAAGGPAGRAGVLLTLMYQGLARYVAWLAVREAGDGRLAALRQYRAQHPRRAMVFGFALVAALGISPFMTLEGRSFAFFAMASSSLWLALLTAIPYTLLAWRTGAVLMDLWFTESETPLPGCDNPAPLPQHSSLLAGGAALLILMGLGRGVFVDAAAALSGGALPHLESAWVLPVIILYVGAFPLLCAKPLFAPWKNTWSVLLALGGLIGVLWAEWEPLPTLFAFIVTGMGVLVSLYSTAYIHDDGRKSGYAFFLGLTFASLLGIVTAEGTGTFITFWEIMTWASFVLIAWERTATARAAALKYLVICGAGAYVMMPGLFALDAWLSPAGSGVQLDAVPAGLLGLALVAVLVGCAAKAGLVPVHGWLPDAHPAAPSSVSAPLSGVLTKIGLFGLVTVFFGLTGITQLERIGVWEGLSVPGLMLTLLGVATMAWGEWQALRQDDVKRLLAYSTMGQLGEIATVLGLGTWLSTTGALAHVLNHAIMKDLLFLAAGALILRTGSRKVADLAGLVRVMPWTVGCMLVGLISVMGLPPFNGFVSKYLMIIACMDAGHPLLAAALLAASLVGAVYYMRLVRVLVFDAPSPEQAPRLAGYADAPWAMRLPLVILAFLCVLFGVVPQAPLVLVSAVSDSLAASGLLPEGSLPAVAVSWPPYVLVPMLGALLPVLLRADRVKAAWASALVLAVTALLVPLFGQHLDTLSFGMALIIPAVGALNLVYAVGYMEHSHTQWRFYAFFLLMTAGLLGVAASTDLFSFFTFWEIMSSWALYFAIAHEGTPEAVREAFKYFLFNVAGAACIFLGIGIIVGQGGTADFAAVGAAMLGLPTLWGTAAMALLALDFTMKAAQMAVRIDWQMHPDLAPTPVSGYISSVLLKIAVFGMVKLFLVFGGVYLRVPGAPELFSQALTMNLVAWAGGLTLLFAAVKAMLQTRIKLVFIWSTVSQIGYMVMAVALGTSLGVAGGLMHLVCHVFFKDLLFFVAGAVMLQTHLGDFERLGGLGRRMPVTMACFALGALNAVGMPPTSGFTSKWLIYQALMEQGEVLLALMALVGSVITLAYLARFVHLVFLGRAGRHVEKVQEAPFIMRAAMVTVAAISLIVGVFPGLFLWPVNSVITEYGLPPLDVAIWGLASGPGAWNATLMSVLMLVAFGGTWWGLQRVLRTVPERRLDPHACGLSPVDAVGAQSPSRLYAALLALFKERGAC